MTTETKTNHKTNLLPKYHNTLGETVMPMTSKMALLHLIRYLLLTYLRLLRWLNGKESTCQHRRPEFDSRVRKIPWRRKWQPTPVLLPAESHGQKTLSGYVHGLAKSWTQLSTHTWSVILSQLSTSVWDHIELGWWVRWLEWVRLPQQS